MDNRISIAAVRANAQSVTVAGRIMAHRKMKNYGFYDVIDESGKIQLLIESSSSLASPNVGDIVCASGAVTTTKTGQLSVKCLDIQILSKGSPDILNALRAISTKDLDLRSQRSLSLMVDNDLKKMVNARSLFIDIIRSHLKTGGFMEVDTPVMSYSRFAGTASVFETQSRTLDKNLYLRGTLEDYLKQLVVAGFEKVFQVGDCFRNESPALISFTMLEATWAYATSEQMLDFTQELVSRLCNDIPDELVDIEMKTELSKKFEVVTFWNVLENYFGFDIRALELVQVQELAKKEGYALPESQHFEYEIAKFGYDVIKRRLAKSFESPTFVSRFPACISPLAKMANNETGEAYRGYGFFKGQRLFEVVEEASDYQEQLDKFQAQDDRSNRSDYSFKHDDLLVSLSYGCPPMAGLGFNVNRVLAVLLNVNRTSDVVAFPLTSAALPL
ncbi:MAG: amino acid--tRNA ligase-related protein [Patescibacteria group bacterium]